MTPAPMNVRPRLEIVSSSSGPPPDSPLGEGRATGAPEARELEAIETQGSSPNPKRGEETLEAEGREPPEAGRAEDALVRTDPPPPAAPPIAEGELESKRASLSAEGGSARPFAAPDEKVWVEAAPPDGSEPADPYSCSRGTSARLEPVPRSRDRPSTPAEFTAAEYLQLASWGRRTVRVEVEGVGAIVVVKGTLWSGMDQEGEGLDAVIRILRRGGLDGSAIARCYEHASAGPRRVDADLDRVLLEAARLEDEASPGAMLPVCSAEGLELLFSVIPPEDPDPTASSAALSRGQPSATSRDEGAPAAVAAEGEVSRGIEALLRRDYGEARDAFARAVALGAESALATCNLQRLAELGFRLE